MALYFAINVNQAMFLITQILHANQLLPLNVVIITAMKQTALSAAVT